MPSYGQLAIDAARVKHEAAVRRDATAYAYAKTLERMKHMIAVDRDSDVISKASDSDRLATLLASVKDFATFLENYVAAAERRSQKEIGK